eukprot:COSAG02_NODE_880_length_16242_cov_5.512946_4_plen_381_part_00
MCENRVPWKEKIGFLGRKKSGSLEGKNRVPWEVCKNGFLYIPPGREANFNGRSYIKTDKLTSVVASRNDLVEDYSHIRSLGEALSGSKVHTYGLANCNFNPATLTTFVESVRWAEAAVASLRCANNPGMEALFLPIGFNLSAGTSTELHKICPSVRCVALGCEIGPKAYEDLVKQYAVGDEDLGDLLPPLIAEGLPRMEPEPEPQRQQWNVTFRSLDLSGDEFASLTDAGMHEILDFCPDIDREAFLQSFTPHDGVLRCKGPLSSISGSTKCPQGFRVAVRHLGLRCDAGDGPPRIQDRRDPREPELKHKLGALLIEVITSSTSAATLGLVFRVNFSWQTAISRRRRGRTHGKWLQALSTNIATRRRERSTEPSPCTPYL